MGIGFDPHRPYQKFAKFLLIRLPLLTSHPSICAQTGRVLRPFCAQLLSVEVAAFTRATSLIPFVLHKQSIASVWLASNLDFGEVC